MTRYDHRTRQTRNITVWPDDSDRLAGAEAMQYRFQWTFPIVLSPHDPNMLYVDRQPRLPLDRRGAAAGSRSAPT